MIGGRGHRALRLRVLALPALVLVLVGPGLAPATIGTPPAYVPLYAEMLSKHTRSVQTKVGTRVDYAALKRDPAWPKVVAALGEVDPERLRDRRAKLAFWINAYNILAIDLVQRNHPVEGIKDIGSLFRPVWGREAGRIGGAPYSLGQIEHEILRPMGEPRIHVAIVCASISCPSLRREPFEADRLDAQLDDSVRDFMAQPEKGMHFDRARGVLTLSRIFDWFAEDFEPVGGVVAYLLPYLSSEDRRAIQTVGEALEVEYFGYDWSLNE